MLNGILTALDSVASLPQSIMAICAASPASSGVSNNKEDKTKQEQEEHCTGSAIDAQIVGGSANCSRC